MAAGVIGVSFSRMLQFDIREARRLTRWTYITLLISRKITPGATQETQPMTISKPDPAARTSSEFWRRTPPALFPSLMGFMGLGLAWRAASQFAPLGASPVASYAILVLASVMLFFVLASYLSKVSLRPRVILEDMASIPGRAGVSALTLSILLFAAAIVPLSSLVATAALVVGLLGHVLIAVLALAVMVRTPQGLVVSPAWHLSFVGFIVAALSAVPLGFAVLGQVILGATVLSSALVYGISLFQLSQTETPPPLRPMLAIHLAPLSLFATVASLSGRGLLALVFATLAMGLAGVLISRVGYLIKAGFSPLWGAFTFPIAALSTALFSLSSQVPLLGWFALLPLALATVITPVIVLRVLRMWSSGVLAAKTGAAIA